MWPRNARWPTSGAGRASRADPELLGSQPSRLGKLCLDPRAPGDLAPGGSTYPEKLWNSSKKSVYRSRTGALCEAPLV